MIETKENISQLYCVVNRSNRALYATKTGNN